MRVLVIGGKGFIGALTVKAFEGVPGAQVVVASRNPSGPGQLKLDLRDRSTFPGMEGFDFVVNCSDSSVAPPEDAAEYCLSTGPAFLETTTDTATHDRLYSRFRARSQEQAAKGMLVLGVGLFPGISNLVAGTLARSVPDCQRLDLGVRLNPLSGAGEGMCAVMAEMLVASAARYEDRRRIDDVAMRPGIPMPFDGVPRSTIQCGLPEGVLLHWSTGVPTTTAYISTTLPLPAPMVKMLTWALARGEGVRRAIRGLLRTQFLVMRARLLRGKPTPVTITAVANRQGSPTGAEPALSFKVDDGVRATACAIAASVQVLGAQARKPGCHFPDEVLQLSDVVERMQALAGKSLEITGPSSPTPALLPASAA
jgi:NAD(P)-dependent dehydrogenase (short-subunit alcohol dehydrogenase family)